MPNDPNDPTTVPDWLAGCPGAAAYTFGVDLGMAGQGHVYIAALDGAGRIVGPFTDVGHLGEGVTVAAVEAQLAAYGFGPEPERRHVEQPAGDVLDTIDATLDNLCACGCGVRLDPGGPSAYFADDDCQWRWNNRHSTIPADVTEPHPPPAARPGPPPFPPGFQPLIDAFTAAQPAGSDTLAVAVWDCPNVLGAGYRVHCPGCDGRVIPSVTRIVDTADRPFHLLNPPAVQVFQRCPHCWVQIPGTPLIANVETAGPPAPDGEQPPTSLVLSLHDGESHVERVLDLAGLWTAEDPDGIIAAVWADMAAVLYQRRSARQVRLDAVAARIRQQYAMPIINTPMSLLHISGM